MSLEALHAGDLDDLEVSLGAINVAMTAEVCRQLVQRAARGMIDAAAAGKKVRIESARDLAKVCTMLKALGDRAATGKIVDLETLGVWEMLPP